MADVTDEDPESLTGSVISEDNSIDHSELEEQPSSDQDEYFVDEGENFLVVADVRDRRAGLRKYRILAIVPLVVGLIVTLGVVLSNRNKAEPSGGVSLQMPPLDIETTCSPTAVSDEPLKCMEVCERADCCDFPTNLPLSCLDGNHQKCLVYHAACHNLDTVDSEEPIPSSVPPAPVMLGEICSSASLQTVDGFADCREACKRAECCYEDNVGTCRHDECEAYAPCLTFKATGHVHQDIEAHVNQVCSSDHIATREGRTECREACSHALCCFTDTCKHDDTAFCSQYSQCNELESSTPVDATHDEIEVACRMNEDTPGHVSLCELVCQKGACCFSDQGCDEIAPQLECGNYEPCDSVFMVQDSTVQQDSQDDGIGISQDSGNDQEGDIPDDETIEQDTPTVNYDTNGDDWKEHMSKEAIDTACVTGELVQLPGQPSLCEQVCQAGRCCFEAEGCKVDDVELFCTRFTACRQFHEADDENPYVDVQAMEVACGDGEGANDDLCDSLCEPGDCCYEPEGCPVPDQERFCANFGPCDDLDDDELMDDGLIEDANDGDIGDTAYDTTTSTTTQEIEKACGNGEGADIDLCDSLCEPGDCCFEPEGCSVPDQEGFCAKFNACDVLDDDEFMDDGLVEDTNLENPSNGESASTTAQEIELACGNDSETVAPPGQPSLCEMLCQPGDCCFQAEGCPADYPEGFCADFELCSNHHREQLADTEESETEQPFD